MARISLIVAMDENRLIGRGQDLPWRLPDDMAWFRRQTMDRPVVMGRKTYETIPPRFKPLPGRTNIVVSRNPDYAAPGAVVVNSPAEALTAAAEVNEIMVAGGAELYRAFLPMTDRIYLTLVHGSFEGDRYFPEIDISLWQEVYRLEHAADAAHACSFTWLILDRKTAALATTISVAATVA